MKITIVGAGYVGLSLSILFAQKYKVVALDIDSRKVNLINNKISPIKDNDIENFLCNKKLNLLATSDKNTAYKNADFIIIATPTNYNVKDSSFDTSSVEGVISDSISLAKKPNIVIKSTIPLGFTDKMRKKFSYSNLFFSPEFLREGRALYDNLYPSRIVIGENSEIAKKFAKLLIECSEFNKKIVKIHYMNSQEAEAVKLFSNTFLAMRIAFFNELDTYAEVNNLESQRIINAVSDDPRIGNYYNNPSFGYGGYCLPKDTRQLLENYSGIPSNLIEAIIESNQTRKKFISKSIIDKRPKSVGIYRLAMKTSSDNFRESAVLDLIVLLQEENIKINLYEPLLEKSVSEKVKLINDLQSFISSSEIIIANRMSSEIEHINNKVYSRDVFREN